MIAKETLNHSKQKDRLSLSPPVIALELKYCQMFVTQFLPEHTLRRLSLSPLAQRRLTHRSAAESSLSASIVIPSLAIKAFNYFWLKRVLRESARRGWGLSISRRPTLSPSPR